MRPTAVHNPPIRITDLVELNRAGAAITCSPVFEVIPVDFTHRSCRFRAVIFLCRFSGTVDSRPFAFRKCYARGCAHDLCPRVSQAIMIANRYLQRDYHRLEQAGIPVERKLFTLEESVANLVNLKGDQGTVMIIDDYIRIAKGGNEVRVEVDLEYVPATEHFEYHRNQQTFLLADFTVTTLGKTAACQRCVGCYPTESEEKDKLLQIQVANARLTQLYAEFERFSMPCQKRFFG
jgi:hypothetical protein